MAQEPNELSAGIQQSKSGEPAHPLTRREMRIREVNGSEDLLTDELERQMRRLRPVSQETAVSEVVPSQTEAHVGGVSGALQKAEQLPLRRDRSNRPPLAETLKATGETSVPEPVFDPVVAEVNIPLSGMQVFSENVHAAKPVLVGSPTNMAALPAPISLIAQTSTLAPLAHSTKERLKLKSRSQKQGNVAKKPPKRRGAQIFSLVAMAFVAGLAIATSIPANALLSPEDISYQAEQSRLGTMAIGDGQSVEGTGENVTAGRDGVSVSAAQAEPTTGAYAPKKLNVNVPVSSNGMRWPVDDVKISSPFGSRSLYGSYNFHTGLDFDPAYGTPIYAVADGIVSLVENPGPTCGVAVFIEHNVDGTKFTSVYCHMVIGSPTLTAGQSVKKGDFVGNIGLTGITTGPHLHLEIRVSDAPIDPYAFLVQHAGKAPNEVWD